MSDIGDFITENIDFSQVEFHYLIDFENGNTISIMKNDFTFGNEVGLIETAVAGENVDKFFERLFGWMTVDDVVMLAEQVEIAHTDNFFISEEFYGSHLPSEDQLKESESKLKEMIGFDKDFDSLF